MPVPWLCLFPACHVQSPRWAPLPSALRFCSCPRCSGTCLRHSPPGSQQGSSPGSEALSGTPRSPNLAPGMTVMTTVMIRRKIRGDLGRAVTPLGTVLRALLAHLTHSSPYTSFAVPVSELMRPRLREVVAAHGHTAWRWLSRAWGSGPVPSLTPLTHGLLGNRACTQPPRVNTSTSEPPRHKAGAGGQGRVVSTLWTLWTRDSWREHEETRLSPTFKCHFSR